MHNAVHENKLKRLDSGIIQLSRRTRVMEERFLLELGSSIKAKEV